MDNKHNSLNLAAKICSDICPWTLSVRRSSQFSSTFALGKLFLLGTDNVRGQISEHIFAPNEGYCLYMVYLCFYTAIPWRKSKSIQSKRLSPHAVTTFVRHFQRLPTPLFCGIVNRIDFSRHKDSSRFPVWAPSCSSFTHPSSSGSLGISYQKHTFIFFSSVAVHHKLLVLMRGSAV